MKIEWEDYATRSFLWCAGTVATIWLDDKWHSNTSPLSGYWDTREEAKNAIVAALRKQYTEILESLPDVIETGQPPGPIQEPGRVEVAG
jgi:hypothetical protein